MVFIWCFPRHTDRPIFFPVFWQCHLEFPISFGNLCSSGSPREDMLDEGRVVNAAVGVFLSGHQTVHLIFCQFLPKCCQDMTELSTHHCSISFFVKDSQTLNKVLKCPLVLGSRDMLQHGQERLKVQVFGVHIFSLGLPQHSQDISVGRVVTQSPHHVSTLGVPYLISPVGVSSKREKASLNSSIWSAVNSSGTHFRSSSGSLGVSGIGAGAGASSF